MDGDASAVNPALLKKLALTSSEVWREERKRAIRSRILKSDGECGELKSISVSAYLPKNFRDSDGDVSDDDVPTNVPPTHLSTVESSYSEANIDLVRTLVASSRVNIIGGKRERSPVSEDPVKRHHLNSFDGNLRERLTNRIHQMKEYIINEGRPAEIDDPLLKTPDIKVTLLNRINEMKLIFPGTTNN
eukprot:Tbor_TRINITY_DN5458_c0_g1::TRINITY_DN5458_c0_g1_i2::g.24594::m.24594